MPVYLCRPGWNAEQPWRHGAQVYAYPFPIPDNLGVSNNKNGSTSPKSHLSTESIARQRQQKSSDMAPNYDEGNAQLRGAIITTTSSEDPFRGGVVVRRVRHTEVVLVDEVSIQYDRYWLRLRWPGPRGGIAGYIALGSYNSQSIPRCVTNATASPFHKTDHQGVPRTDMQIRKPSEIPDTRYTRSPSPTGSDNEDAPMITNGDEDDLDPIVSSSSGIIDDDLDRPIASSENPLMPRCESTGLYFPSSSAMELLANYDDGLSDPIDGINSNDEGQGEPVFCRICREGLHDVNYDTHDFNEGSKNKSNDSDTESRRNSHHSTENNSEHTGRDGPDQSGEPNSSENALSIPSVTTHHPYAENPLLAPCQCIGSMAFVHYLCIEQWRCRSNHPSAKNGLNCETCESMYSLPPPPSRPVSQTNDDWEAMPPHVLAALRRPHLAWQVGAAIVRRRWLRPIAPVIISPIVALYCRARRLLKKRGVSRRRWACSLCRRRARWKCVRCLRSYYCSRQCQNVSWHIVHKHVCYKPARFWWSVVVYGLGTITCFPGILRDPFIYDLGVVSVLLSFTIMGVIGGGVAQSLKKVHGVDIRGRSLELLVVLSTLILAWITWGLVWAFFGESNSCLGLGTYLSANGVFAKEDFQTSAHLTILRNFLLRPAKVMLSMLDKSVMKMGPRVSKHLCVSNESGDITNCLRLARRANPDFFFIEDSTGDKCRADVSLVTSIWLTAGAVFFLGHVFKRRERRAPGRHRPHQD